MNRKNIISLTITLAVLVIIGLVVVPQFASYDAVLETIQTLSKVDVGIILAFTAINIFVYAWPFMAATPGIRFWPAFMIRQTSFLLSNAFPGGGTVGVGVQYAMAGTYNLKGSVASSGIVSTSIWNMLATVSLPGISLLIVWLSGERTGSSPIAGFIGIAAAVFSITGFAMLMKSEKTAERLSSQIDNLYKSLRKRFSKLPKQDIARSLTDFRKATYETTTKHWPMLAASNLAQQLAQYAVLLVILNLLLSEPVSIALTLSAFAFARIGTFIPLTPGGLGTVDAILISLLVQAGISSEVAAAATLLWRATTYFPQLFIGLITFLSWRFKSIRKVPIKP